MKYILIIGDGMADNPLPELGDMTPLQFSSIPHIDALAAKGSVGSVRTCPQGLPPGSDTGILSIFGADPLKYYTGRSPLEAAASGIELKSGDVSYRCNMIALEDINGHFSEKAILSHSGGSIEGSESIELIEYLFNNPEFKLEADKAGMKIYPAESFRHIAVQRAANIKNIKLAPPHDHLGEKIGKHLPSGCPNAELLKNLMEIAHNILDRHPVNEKRRASGKLPANGIWFWAEGTGVELPSFEQQFGHRGTVISAVPLCHGIARLSGLKAIQPVGATGELDSNLEAKVEACLDSLKGGDDFAAIHVEAPDECTHNGDLKGKLQAIEWLDSRVFVLLTEALSREAFDYRILFLADHKTLTSTRGHDGDPVPFMIFDSRRDTGAGLPYTEEAGLQGPFFADGTSLMPLLFEL